jgi:hypothetical protein
MRKCVFEWSMKECRVIVIARVLLSPPIDRRHVIAVAAPPASSAGGYGNARGIEYLVRSPAHPGPMEPAYTHTRRLMAAAISNPRGML